MTEAERKVIEVAINVGKGGIDLRELRQAVAELDAQPESAPTLDGEHWKFVEGKPVWMSGACVGKCLLDLRAALRRHGL